MLFRLTHPESGKETHCGVLEFTAEEGCVYIPFWMMQNLLIEEGSLLTVTNVSLPKASFVKLQPQSVDFLEISNPRAVLEHALRNFSCVTLGDIIQIPYNSKNYHFELKEVQPAPAACIIETDCNVDFDAPVGYVEPSRSQRSSACPSPATSQSAASLGSLMDTTTSTTVGGEDGALPSSPTKPSGVRIVDGKIVRPADDATQQSTLLTASTTMMADRIGGTGVQLNAATLPQAAPTVDYWAVQAGDGARLDGKAAPVLKDASGQEVDVRRLRAEAAAKRAEALAAANASASSSSSGQTLNGKPAVDGESKAAAATPASSGPVSKRKTLGGKYSRLKQSGVAFQGSANTFDNGSK